MPNIETWNFGDPKILFLKGVIFLHRLFTKSVISGSKCPTSEKKLHVLARACLCSACACSWMAVLEPCPDLKVQVWEGVNSLSKCFTISVISGSKCCKSKNLEIWNSGDPKILFWEGVIFLHRLFTKSVISGTKCPKPENSKICSCLRVLARAQPVLAREWPCSSRAQTWKSSFRRVSFPFLNSSQNRWYLARNAQNQDIWKSRTLES